MNAVIFQHHFGSPVSLPGLLERAGVACDIVPSFARGALTAAFDATAHDIAIFLGGPQGAHQTDLYPYLERELDIIRARHGAGLPSLGICLGAQLIAKALGGESFKGEEGRFTEIGWYPLTLTEAGRATALRHFDAAAGQARVLESHDDTFTRPPGAVLLARSERCENQAFIVGEASWGVQFHPEVTEIGCDSFDAGCAKPTGAGKFDLAQFRADTAAYLPAATAQTECFMRDWLHDMVPVIQRARRPALAP